MKPLRVRGFDCEVKLAFALRVHRVMGLGAHPSSPHSHDRARRRHLARWDTLDIRTPGLSAPGPRA